MDYFKELFFDGNKWLTTLGLRLRDMLTRNGLFISEDITFIDTLIDSQTDFETQCLEPMSSHFNKNALILFSITSGLLWYESNLTSYRPLFGSIICGISWKLSSFAYNVINKIYLKHQLIVKSIDLSERLAKERHLINKYFKLIEDYEAIEDNGKHLTQISEMKDKFRNICWNCFKNFREITISLRQSFPMNSEIDEEMNYLCCFPINTFDNFVSKNKSDISLSLLKSLMHLKRLQQSECFRRIVCLFLTVCIDKRSNNQTTDQYIQNIAKQVLKTFDNIIEESKQTYPELLSVYNCAKSLWISSEKSLIKCRDLKQTNQTIETMNILNTNRSIRKHLFTSLNLLDDCDSLIENGIQCSQLRDKMREKLNSINAEFKNLNDLVINLEKVLRIEELREINLRPSVKSDDMIENSKSFITRLNFEDYVVKDQVFEAIVTEGYDHGESDIDPNDDQLWEMRLKLAQESDASNSLFRELKVALKSKAVEHQKREAIALGIEFDELSQQLDGVLQTQENLSPESSNEEPLNDSKLKQNNSVLEKPFIENNPNFGLNSFGFQSQMATIAAQKALLFASSKQMENFGDDSSSEEEEYEE